MTNANSRAIAFGQIISCFFIATLLLPSCSTHRRAISKAPGVNLISNTEASRNNDAIKKERKDIIAAYVPYTASSYIDRFKNIAIQEMNLNGIPASITLAQGLFESGNGNGDLAKIANNHFGIKCTSDWHGRSYYKDDDLVNDCFRVYDNPEDSYRDHSNFLKRKRYAPLFELDKNDYKGWAYGLKQAGYATNPKYPDMIIGIIEKYHLHQYDRPESETQKIKREDRVLTQINQNIGKAVKDSLIQNTSPAKLYTIKTGDTLYNISRRFGLTVDELKALNNMADNTIKIGQTLVIAK